MSWLILSVHKERQTTSFILYAILIWTISVFRQIAALLAIVLGVGINDALYPGRVLGDSGVNARVFCKASASSPGGHP